MRKALLLSYFNTEMLVENSSFLKLLSHSTFTPLEAWVPFDDSQIQQGWASFIFREHYGKRDLAWLAKRDAAHEALNAVWTHVRGVYRNIKE